MPKSFELTSQYVNKDLKYLFRHLECLGMWWAHLVAQWKQWVVVGGPQVNVCIWDHYLQAIPLCVYTVSIFFLCVCVCVFIQ